MFKTERIEWRNMISIQSSQNWFSGQNSTDSSRSEHSLIDNTKKKYDKNDEGQKQKETESLPAVFILLFEAVLIKPSSRLKNEYRGFKNFQEIYCWFFVIYLIRC